MSSHQFHIVTNPTRQQWEEIIYLIVEELNWSNSVEDLDSWTQAFPPGHFCLYMAIENLTNKVLGTITRTNYITKGLEPISSIGLFYIRPQYRGNSIGTALWTTAMQDCVDNKFLFGAEKMWQKYADKSGFSHLPKWKVDFISLACCHLNPSLLKQSLPANLRLMSWTAVPFESITEFDKHLLNGIDRSMYLRSFLQQQESTTKVTINDWNGAVTGICRIRKIIGGHLEVGPFYAASQEVAAALLASTLQEMSGWREQSNIYFKIPTDNDSAQQLVDAIGGGKHQLEYVLTPQYTKHILQIDTHLVYSVTETDVALL